MQQKARFTSVYGFRVFTLAARGLDIKGLRTVVNFDCARDIDSHTHRIGRTGRAGLHCFALLYNFFSFFQVLFWIRIYRFTHFFVRQTIIWQFSNPSFFANHDLPMPTHLAPLPPRRARRHGVHADHAQRVALCRRFGGLSRSGQSTGAARTPRCRPTGSYFCINHDL